MIAFANTSIGNEKNSLQFTSHHESAKIVLTELFFARVFVYRHYLVHFYKNRLKEIA